MALNEINQQAINQALAGNWQAAVDCNEEILKENPKDIEALTRLAKAYGELGKKKLALKTYRRVLRIDRFNPIVKKNLRKLIAKKTNKKNNKTVLINPNLFLKEPGKTKVVPLIKLCSPEILLELNIGDNVKLLPRKRSISIYDKSQRYLGKIPDDLSQRLIKLIKGGNQYQAVIKAAEEKKLLIFIKEEKQSKRNADIPSFPLAKEQYYSFIPNSVIKREPIEEIENHEE